MQPSNLQTGALYASTIVGSFDTSLLLKRFARKVENVNLSDSDDARLDVAVPDVEQARLRADSLAVLEAFSSVRSLTKRLLTATSIEDVLTTANEHIADWFDGALLVNTSRRNESGIWECQAVDDKQAQTDAAIIIEDLKSVLPTPDFHAALNLHPQLTNPGDLGTPDLYPLSIQRVIRTVYASRSLPRFARLYARVRSRTGFLGGLCISHEYGHSYSASDYAVLSAFADLTSFALS